MASDSVVAMVKSRQADGTLSVMIIELKEQLQREKNEFGIEQIPTQIELETALKVQKGLPV